MVHVGLDDDEDSCTRVGRAYGSHSESLTGK